MTVLVGALFAWEAYRAVGALQDANVSANVLKDNIVEGDVDAARRTLTAVDDATSRAHANSDGPIWWLGSHVPVLGRNVDAVRTVSRELDRISDEVLPSIVDVADKVRLETFRPVDGRVDLAAVAEAAPILVTADDVFAEANREVGSFDVEELIGPLRAPMTTLQAQFVDTAGAASSANDAARLLPGMLERRRQETHLLAADPQQRRGAFLGGHAWLGGRAHGEERQDSRWANRARIADVPPLKKAAIKLTKEEKSIFQTTIATDMRDTASIPTSREQPSWLRPSSASAGSRSTTV